MPCLKDDELLTCSLLAAILKEQGVLKASANCSCASLTIYFDANKFDPVLWLDELKLCQLNRVLLPCKTAESGAFMAAVHRATFYFEEKLPPKLQCALGTIALLSSLLEVPAFITRVVISMALLPIANRALQTLFGERRLGADALDAASGLILVQERAFLPAALMVFLVGLGELIRDILTANCQSMIAHQLALSRRSAWVIKGKKRVRMPVQELHAGDMLVVYEGELIVVDGIVTAGEGTVVPAHPASDFEPQLVRAGDRVCDDTVLTDGKLYLRFDRCVLAEPNDPVLEKEKRRWLQRTHLHRNALRLAYKRVLPVLSAAALLFVLTRNFHRAMALIYFDFITGIKIAIPTAVLASMYQAGRRGIVIRNASALERLSEVNLIVFARSGTLTALKPSVTDVFLSDGFSFEDVMRWAAAVEERYNHLGAFAIYRYANLHTIPVPERTSSTVHSGLGVSGHVEGRDLLVGSTRYMEMQQVDLSVASDFLNKCMERGDVRLCVCVDSKLAGVIAFQDPLRADACESISELRNLGISEIVMTTGGSQAAAENLAEKVGISRVHSRTMPEDQANIVREYKRAGYTVAVVGFDVDDSLALEQADVAITLSSGADVARYRADVVLNEDSLYGLVEGVRIARSGMALARQNLRLVSVPNWFGLGLTSIALADPLTATLLNNGSVIIGAVNGLRPLLDDSSSVDACLI